MRIVLSTTREVAHYWANQVQSEGRASALSFNGTTLNSYAAQVAQLVPSAKAVLFDARYEGYSPTTSRHLREARHALSATDWPNRFSVANIHVDPVTAATSDTPTACCQLKAISQRVHTRHGEKCESAKQQTLPRIRSARHCHNRQRVLQSFQCAGRAIQ